MAQLSDDCFAFGGPMMSVDEAVGIIAARVVAVQDVETALPVAHLDDIPAIAAMMQRSAISVEDLLARSAPKPET